MNRLPYPPYPPPPSPVEQPGEPDPPEEDTMNREVAERLEDMTLDMLAIIHMLSKSETPPDLRHSYTLALHTMSRRWAILFDQAMREKQSRPTGTVSQLY